MKNSKTTKRALVSSAVAIILCVTMLVGNTFAWFTDTASTSVNKIQAGTLDVELGRYDDGTWVSLEDETLNFVKADDASENEEILWEPGCTYELEEVIIRNNGNLALKYEVVVSGLKGDAKLNEVIDWSYKVKEPERVSIYSAETVADDKYLLPGEEATLTISGHMNKDAGNEYQGLSIDGAAITVYATQYTYEYDSNNDQYDEGATLPSIWDGETTTAPTKDTEDGKYHITSAAEFYSFVSGNFSIPAGSIVVLDCDIDLGGATVKGYNSGCFDSSFDGQGHTVSNFTVTTTYFDGEHYCGLFPYIYNGNYVKNLTVKNAIAIAHEGVGMVGIISGAAYENTTVENCHVINCTVIGEKKVGSVLGYTNGTVTNCSATDCDVYAKVNKNEVSGGKDHQAGEVVGYIDNSGNVATDVTFENVSVTFNANVTTISSASDLAKLKTIVKTANTVVLLNDIDMTGVTYTPWDFVFDKQATTFTFDGNGHTIKGLTTARSDGTWGAMGGAGLFASVDSAADNNPNTLIIKDLTMDNASVSATNVGCAAALVGYGHEVNITIDNCEVVNSSITSDNFAAAFIGYGSQSYEYITYKVVDSTVDNCEITGNDATAGVIGLSNFTSIIDNTTVTNNIINGGNGHSAAALVGTGSMSATNYTVSGNKYIGGGNCSADIVDSTLGVYHPYSPDTK